MKLGFFGTPSLASSVLQDLVNNSNFEICFVVTNPDKPFGRHGELKASPVKELAIEAAIEVLQPEKIRGNEQFLNHIRSYNCDYFVVVAYGKILPKELLDIPTKMCINVHGSILPKYRGASPIQSALLHGERETGVTIMQMSEGMDEGDILKIRYIKIVDDETSGTLFDKFAEISGPTLIQTLLELEHGGITPLPQDASQATYCKKIEKEDGLVDWSKSAQTIYRQWQAYTPWPGIYTMYEGKRLLLEKVSWSRHPEGNEGSREEQRQPNYAPNDKNTGTIIQIPDSQIGVVCGDAILTLEQVKLEGKKSQNIRDFMNGNQIVGYRL